MCYYLINERGKAVVETLDLLFLLCANNLDFGVDVYLQRGEQALVDGHRCNLAQIRPGADLGDGVGSHGHAAESSWRHMQSFTAAALAPQTHGSAVWRFHCWRGWKGLLSSVVHLLSFGCYFIGKTGCGVIVKLCGSPMWVNQSDACHLFSHLPPLYRLHCFSCYSGIQAFSAGLGVLHLSNRFLWSV